MPYKQEEEPIEEAQADVTLEMDSLGNQFLHLILPANRINFLNGMDNGEQTFFQNDEDCENNFFSDSDAQEPMMIEVGCKVFEVNRVAYRPTIPSNVQDM